MFSLPTIHKRVSFASPYERVRWRHYSGPEDFGGLIGKQLVKCELLAVVDFEAVQVPEITIDEKDLSSDQKYLFSIFNAERMGFVSPHLASQKAGPLNHSRWLTTACRILRRYVSTS